jgi:protein-S-isoprenylcysteine O-methyltransferase Ste14
MALRHTCSVLALPFMVAVVVPVWLARRNAVGLDWPAAVGGWVAVSAGALSLAVGLVLFAASLARFVIDGKGTLAPWDPPRHLVVVGPYRYVRNPMISGVWFVLIGEALLLRSLAHLWWAGLFAAINAVYIAWVEEPQLARRFGESYRTYCQNVPRLWPRRTAWRQT